MTVPLKTRVLIADDHALVRHGLRLALDEEPDIEVVGEVGDGAEAVRRCIEGEVDLALLDVSMPKLTGLQAARQIATYSPTVRTLVLSMHDSEQYLLEALRVRAAGYVLKSAAHRELVEACRRAMRGEPFFYPDTVPPLVADHIERAKEGEPVSGEVLSPRETEVTKLVAEGRSTREIAETLMISEKTVERHRGNILEKLGIENRVELTRYAIRRGLVEP